MIYRLGLVWGCCALALAACTKPHQGGTLPPARPSASAVASPTPSPTHSSTPAGDKVAIVALAKQYYAESNAAIRTGDTSGLRALMIDGCPCAKFADHVDADWKRGTVPVLGYYHVTEVAAPVLRSAAQAFVSVLFTTSEYKVLSRTGAVLVDIPEDRSLGSNTLECRLVEGKWKVIDVVRS
ncbi:MAG: hypothetical protein M3042_01065 [Actinomycetota bacterium]|nr:hypothetical protein [Actinomycetota bacterium]